MPVTSMSASGRLCAVAALVEGLTWAGLLVGMWLKCGAEVTDTGVWLFGCLHGAAFLLLRGGHPGRGHMAALAGLGAVAGPGGGGAAAGNGAARVVVPPRGPAVACNRALTAMQRQAARSSCRLA